MVVNKLLSYISGEQVETLDPKQDKVCCNGGSEIFGHPRIWLKTKDSEIICPYCSRSYVLSNNTTSR